MILFYVLIPRATSTFTASFRNACGYESTDSRTFIVGGTACQ